MNKEKFGRLFYYTALIIAIIVMAIALFIQSDGSEEQNARVSIIRYMIAFYSFLGLISPGALVREYTLGYSVYKKFKCFILINAHFVQDWRRYGRERESVPGSGRIFIAWYGWRAVHQDSCRRGYSDR